MTQGLGSQGFLVVERSPQLVQGSLNPKYRGLYRTPPFRQEMYDKGFEDPYLTGKVLNEDGLIARLEDVESVLDVFSRMVDRDDLEIIYAERRDVLNVPLSYHAYRFLGFDVATRSPFWSIVADLDVSYPEGRDIQAKLNENGLLASAQAGMQYRQAYGDTHPEDSSVDLLIWAVSLLGPEART
jgi:hypothetical protein